MMTKEGSTKILVHDPIGGNLIKIRCLNRSHVHYTSVERMRPNLTSNFN